MNNTTLNRFKIIYGFSFLLLLVLYIKSSFSYEEFIGVSGSGERLGLVIDLRTLVLSLVIVVLIPLYFLIVRQLKKKK